MSRRKVIYFLSAFVLIIGCYALNLSYSLFTQNIATDNIVDSSVPILDATLEKIDEENTEPLTTFVTYDVPANSGKVIKLKINNNSSVTINYGIKINDLKGTTIKVVEGYSTNGNVTASNTKEILLYVLNDSDTDITELKIDLISKYETQTMLETDYLTNLETIYLLNKSIIRNTTSNLNGTELVDSPPTNVAEMVNGTNEKVLTTTEDDFTLTTGNNSYYFRGNVIDNYVNFAEMCWKIVRIDGNSDIKIVLEDQDQTCETSNGNWNINKGHFGYTKFDANSLQDSNNQTNSDVRYIQDYLQGGTSQQTSMATIFKTFQNNFTEHELSKLKSGNWCIDNSGYLQSGSFGAFEYSLLNDIQINNKRVMGEEIYYGATTRIMGEYNKEGFKPSLKCEKDLIMNFDDDENSPTQMYVATMTIDEIIYAGGKYNESNTSNYLLNSYQSGNNLTWWTLTPELFNGPYEFIYYMDYSGKILSNSINNDNSLRPTVILSNNTVITDGTGIKTDPYVIG